MAIIKFTTKYNSPEFALLNLFPDQFVSEKEKSTNNWWKVNMDYFYNVAVQQYSYNKKKIIPNYELVKGKISRKDFYKEQEVRSFTETLLESEELPAYVKHYSILTPPINTMVGELTKRPDNILVKAFDEDSQQEELDFRTNICQKLIMDMAREKIIQKAAMEGTTIEDEDELNKMTIEKAQEEIGSYTTQAERWGSRMLDFLKMRLSMKEKSEDVFRDLLISARGYFHIYEDNSELGLTVRVENPKSVWWLSTQDQNYTSDPFNKNVGAYAAGTISIMELSEIINTFKLTIDEIKHLRSQAQQGYLLTGKPSNLVNPGVTGPDSVTYNNYDPAILQYRQLLEGELQSNRDELSSLLGITTSASVFGQKFLVVRAYWCSKKKVGQLTYIDDDGQEVSKMVDENYKDGTHPQEISIEWGWINQWYQGVKIGLDVYYVKPLEILDYCPIIGVLFEPKNVDAPPSLVDQMKPFQMLYNIAMNQLFRLLEKDMGVVFLTSIRHVPVPKDGNYEDALEVWEAEAREKGIIFVDDSPENLKSPSSFNQHNRVDLSRSNEIQARYNLAVQMRTECWKLVGLSEQRLGESKATETATAINSALTQSYAQTENWFAQHEYLLNKLYQALLDAALYIESKKPVSTISYISGDGPRVFVQVNGSDLKLKDLGVFVTSRTEDARNYQEFRSLAQAMLQNGATPYEVAVLYSTKSMRQMRDILKSLKEKQEEFQQQQQQIEQQKLQQQQQMAEREQQLAELQHEKDQQFEAYQREQDRLSKEKIALITATAKSGGEDANANGLPDVLELQKYNAEQAKSQSEYELKMRELSQKQQDILMKNAMDAQNIQLQKDKIAVERHKINQQVKIAKMNKANKPTKK